MNYIDVELLIFIGILVGMGFNACWATIGLLTQKSFYKFLFDKPFALEILVHWLPFGIHSVAAFLMVIFGDLQSQISGFAIIYLYAINFLILEGSKFPISRVFNLYMIAIINLVLSMIVAAFVLNHL